MKTSRPEYHTESDGYIRTRSQVRVQQGVTIILRLCTLRRKGIVLHVSKQAFSHALYSVIVTYSYVFTSRGMRCVFPIFFISLSLSYFLIIHFSVVFQFFLTRSCWIGENLFGMSAPHICVANVARQFSFSDLFGIVVFSQDGLL